MNAVLFLGCQLAVSRDCMQVYCRSLLLHISFQLYSLTKAFDSTRLVVFIQKKTQTGEQHCIHVSCSLLKYKENHTVKVFVVDLRGVTHNP